MRRGWAESHLSAAGERARGLAPALVVVALGAVVLAGLPWPCAFLLLTGLPCPTCGMTRAFRFALRGDFQAAFHMHPLWVLVGPVCFAIGLGEVAAYARTGRWGKTIDVRWVRWWLGALAMALVVVWIARFGGAFGGPVTPAATGVRMPGEGLRMSRDGVRMSGDGVCITGDGAQRARAGLRR